MYQTIVPVALDIRYGEEVDGGPHEGLALVDGTFTRCSRTSASDFLADRRKTLTAT